MSGATRLGCSLWDWDRFVVLSYPSRNLFLALYTCPNVKRSIPGLFHGGIASLAESSRMAPDEVVAALDDLVRRGLAEWDRDHHVIRLTALPDTLERPMNGRVLHSWWTRFQVVPSCGVRDAHIALVRWLLETGGAVTEDHSKAWDKTFGSLQIPARRRRGVREVRPDASASHPQADLFASAGLGYRIGIPSGSGSSESGSESEGLPRAHAIPGPGLVVDAPPPATVPALAPSDPAVQEPPLARVIALPVARAAKTTLPFTIANMLDAVEGASAGRFITGVFDPRLAKPLTDLIRLCDDQGMGVEAFAQVGAWLATGILDWRGEVLGPKWLATTGKFFDALNQARATPPPARRGDHRRPTPPQPQPSTSPPGGQRRKL